MDPMGCRRFLVQNHDQISRCTKEQALEVPSWIVSYLQCGPQLCKMVYTPSFLIGLTLLIPFITGVITHLLSGMSHQVVIISNQVANWAPISHISRPKNTGDHNLFDRKPAAMPKTDLQWRSASSNRSHSIKKYNPTLSNIKHYQYQFGDPIFHIKHYQPWHVFVLHRSQVRLFFGAAVCIYPLQHRASNVAMEWFSHSLW